MKKLLSHFGRLSILVTVLLVAIVVLGGGYIFYSRDTSLHNPMSNWSTSNWQTYTSPASGAQFRYPTSWHILRNMMGIAQPSWLLENVRIQGPNSFQLIFQVQKPHPDPAMMCARTYDSEPVQLTADYDTILEGTDSQHINTIFLVNHGSDHTRGFGCGLSFYANPVNSNMGFLFYGHYTDNTTRSLNETEYAQQSEVMVAKEIFASFRL